MFHIAIADDNEMCLKMTAEMMRQYIYENSATDITFTCFRTPFDLMDSVEAGAKYDTFLLDIVMPGMSGIEIAKELHQMGIGVPIIFLTSEKKYALEAFRVGATQYLVKGFTYAELKETLDRSVRIVSRERRRQIILNTRGGGTDTFSAEISYTPLRTGIIRTSYWTTTTCWKCAFRIKRSQRNLRRASIFSI